MKDQNFTIWDEMRIINQCEHQMYESEKAALARSRHPEHYEHDYPGNCSQDIVNYEDKHGV